MLQLIYGPDTFTANERLREVSAQSGGGEWRAGATHWLDGRAITPREVIEALGQCSLFSETKIVVVDGLLSRFSRSRARRRPPRAKRQRATPDGLGDWEQFPEQVRSLPESTVLILIDAEVREPNALLDALAPYAADVIRCPLLGTSQLVAWIQKRTAARGGRIAGAAASRLAEIVGSDLWQMDSELQKLVSYADGEPITVSMIDAMAASAPSPTIFMLVDAMVERNVQQAHRRLDDLYSKGLSAGYVFTMVARQLRLIALIHESRGNKGAPPSTELSGLAPFALRRATQQAQRLPENGVRRALEHAVAADRRIKTGRAGERIALDMLISDIVAAAAD